MSVINPRVPRRFTTMSSNRRKKALLLSSMALPGTLWLLLLRYLPMFGIVLAFKDYRAYKPNTFWNNIIKSDWVGFDNFRFLFKSPDTGTDDSQHAFDTTSLFIVLGLVVAVAFAIMLSELTQPLRRQNLPNADVLPLLS